MTPFFEDVRSWYWDITINFEKKVCYFFGHKWSKFKLCDNHYECFKQCSRCNKFEFTQNRKIIEEAKHE